MNRRVEKDSNRIRIFLLALFSILAVGATIARLFYLQVIEHERYLDLAQRQHKLSQELTAERGEIFISDSLASAPYPVVVNVNKPLVYVDPAQVEDAGKVADLLAGYLGLSSKDILKKISNTDRRYVVIAKEVSEETVEKIKQQGLSGVAFENEVYQNYTEKELASQILGFVGFDGNQRSGRYGLERYYEKELAGSPGYIESSGVFGQIGAYAGEDGELIPAVDGADIYLTIERAIQFKAEEVLKRAVLEHGAKSGSVVVVNPKTGAILAMANYPTFDPNKFNEAEDPGVYNNLAVQIPYEPGSVIKPITMSAALDEGAVEPDTVFEDPGYIDLENFTIRNSDKKAHGPVTMTVVLEQSINTGVVYAENKVGHKKFAEYLESFGYGEQTGIDLPFESPGNIDNLYLGGDLYPATISYGQGMTATPLQVVMSYAAIANGGKLMKPYVVKEIDHGGVVEKFTPQEVRQVISKETSNTVGAMLVSVVESGHGTKAAVPGYFIAGKTGTAQVAYSDRAGYDPARTIGSFAGFGPIDDPVFAMIVKIEEPQEVRFAETTAAPAFGEIAQFILNYYQVKTTR